MKFNDVEVSEDLGEPINLYKFIYGPDPLDFYGYTDAEVRVIMDSDDDGNGEPYHPVAIRRNDINSAGTTDKTTMEIELASNDPVAEMFRVYPPSYPVAVFIWQGHIGAEDFALSWSGRVLSASRDGKGGASLTCEPSSVSMQRVGLRRHYQYMCSHPLYGPQCKANKAASTATVYAETVSGRQITLGGLLTNGAQYAGGILEWVNAQGLTEYRTILTVTTADSKTVLTLSGIAREVEPGAPILASKGCNRTLTDCGGIHNNVPNYGGFPFIPTKNPLGRSTPFL